MSTKKMTSDTYVNILTDETPREFAFNAKNPDELRKWQRALSEKLNKAMGIDKIASRGDCPLNPVKLFERVEDDHIVEQWKICTEPGFELPFYVLLPKNTDTPKPLVITPHGHSKYGMDNYIGVYHCEEEKKDALEGERDIALQAVKAGYVAIAPEMRGFGELRLKEDIETDETYSDRKLAMRALMFGRTLLAERVWDMSKLIDYAETRPEIDTSKIAITGNSGGGTASLFTAAYEKRITVAMPSCYFCTFQGSIGSIRHCECNYITGIISIAEMYEIAGLIAPRPFLAIAGREDDIFPIEHVKFAFDKLKEIYKTAEAENNCELYVGAGGHRYYKEYAWDFLAKAFA